MTLQKGDACLQQLKKTFKQKAVSVTGQCVNCAALQTLLNMTGMFFVLLGEQFCDSRILALPANVVV